MLITFSGLDGAGKSTLIAFLKDSLERDNQSVAVSHMNYDVGMYPMLRSLLGKRADGQNNHAPSEAAFDKKFSTVGAKLRYQLVWNKGLRFLIYPIDVLIFLVYRFYVERVNQKVLIMDRYFYDTLVDITGARRTLKTRLLSWLTPTPNLSIFLDCNPERAFVRKNEYSIEYLNRRRLSYHKLISELPGMLVFSTDQDLNVTQMNLCTAVRQRMVAPCQ